MFAKMSNKITFNFKTSGRQMQYTSLTNDTETFQGCKLISKFSKCEAIVGLKIYETLTLIICQSKLLQCFEFYWIASTVLFVTEHLNIQIEVTITLDDVVYSLKVRNGKIKVTNITSRFRNLKSAPHLTILSQSKDVFFCNDHIYYKSSLNNGPYLYNFECIPLSQIYIKIHTVLATQLQSINVNINLF